MASIQPGLEPPTVYMETGANTTTGPSHLMANQDSSFDKYDFISSKHWRAPKSNLIETVLKEIVEQTFHSSPLSAKKLQLIYAILTATAIPFSLGMLLYCPANTYAGVDLSYSQILNSSQLR